MWFPPTLFIYFIAECINLRPQKSRVLGTPPPVTACDMTHGGATERSLGLHSGELALAAVHHASGGGLVREVLLCWVP